jgi:hypothetical protein
LRRRWQRRRWFPGRFRWIRWWLGRWLRGRLGWWIGWRFGGGVAGVPIVYLAHQDSANAGFYLVYNEVDDRNFGALPAGRELIVKYSRIFDVFE